MNMIIYEYDTLWIWYFMKMILYEYDTLWIQISIVETNV